MSREYQICSRCVMDTSDKEIEFDSQGVCTYCRHYDKYFRGIYYLDDKLKEERLHQLVAKIKRDGRGKEYDCVIGLSGGVDSSYTAYVVKNLGLRPLAIHLDNGWNTELAVKNIENIVKKLGIDLFTYVIDWEEFKALQLAFLKASVVDLEMISDNAIFAAIYKIAKDKGTKYFLAGTNLATESVMPPSWFYSVKYDSLNIKAIYKRFGHGPKLRTYPILNFLEYLDFRYFNKFKFISMLNYVPYDKNKAKELLIDKLGWKDYGGKHGESRITRFYQEYILPVKFG
ncbi:MAG: N-acetyl sugar amidotransferase, partial [Candidatus Margulisbacteria bacterium]|nr:N-acetyl sugar amidotransferase [Candidatus Margulisiibacteriota bacterium]